MFRSMFLVLVLLLPLWLAGCDDSAPTVGHQQLQQLARDVARGERRLTAEQLAARLIGDREPLEVIDLRPAAAYAEGHIKGARNLGVTDLLKGQAPLPDGEWILYDEDGGQAAQAVLLLALTKRRALALAGGWRAWQAHLQAPQGDPLAERRRVAANCFFDGDFLAESGLPVRPVEATSPAGFVPPLEPVDRPPGGETNGLGLGLSLGLGPAMPAQQPSADPLGLGLGMGPASPHDQAKPKGALVVGEGC